MQSKQINNLGLENAVKGFIVLQPIFYIFLHLVYMAANSEIQTVTQRVKLIALSPVYAALQYTKLLGASSYA